MSNLINQKFIPNLASIYNEDLSNQLANTQGAISALKQLSSLLLNPMLLMNPILAKEAESSSQLEGTQASADDVYKLDIEDQSSEVRNEAIEIRNYQDAMRTGLKIVKQTGINQLVIREIHKELMKGVRGSKKHPGEYRKGEVWIGADGTSKGEARYVPPDALQVPNLMDMLSDLMNNRSSIHPLIACGIIHHRFEAIHPFEDGNGRTGRLIISLYLIKEGLLSLPILYPSGFFEKNKDDYTALLHEVDEEQSWYSWLLYFLHALEEQANVSYKTGMKIFALFKDSRELIQDEKAGIKLISVLEDTFSRPYITRTMLYEELGIPLTTGTRYLETLAQKNIVETFNSTSVKNERIYVNRQLLNILSKI